MARSDFLRRLSNASRDLRDYLNDDSQRWLTNIARRGHDPELRDGKGADLKIDRIYELLCYFALLAKLNETVELKFVKGEGRFGYRFPYGPASKQNFAFFRFEWESKTYDICNGTALDIMNEPSENPDISLQQMEDETSRRPGNALAIWDAKYHEKGALGKPDICQMFFWTSIFELMEYSSNDVLEQLMPAQFQVSAVITNASSRPDHKRPLLQNGFSVVLNFIGPNTGDLPEPSRSEHLMQATMS